MLITKDQFCHFVNRLKHCYEEQDKFNAALGPYFERPIVTYGQKAIDSLEELLITVCECENEDDIFVWWIHECNEDNRWLTVQDTNTGKKREFDVLTPEGLYEYLHYMYNKN